ncbi:sodium- and chloride-dependent glycine transporter 2-like [Ptychodera flava]|uniref:sodium- and chloride-dependent glycine transporter 2-like n=1 Tax=Ptychodera flava TaxID=63121 RepID=UPI00396AA403
MNSLKTVWTKLPFLKRQHSSYSVETMNNVNASSQMHKTEEKESDTKESKEVPDEKDAQDENPVRGNWSNKTELILAHVGYVISTENLLRFPYLCSKNGGVAFLVPYLIALFLVGLPIVFMEIAMGQFASRGCIGVWECVPLFKGLGIGMLITTAIMTIYQGLYLSYSLFYLVASFTDLPGLPWVGCGHDWNTGLCFDERDLNFPAAQLSNETTSASGEYFDHFVLAISPGIETSGDRRWRLAACLLTGWIIVYLCVIRGVKSIGKVAYITTTLPYLLLVILLIRGCILDGARSGLEYYLGKADFNTLRDLRVWKDATRHIIYSLNLATGGLFTLASFNKFHNNAFHVSLIITLSHALTSVICGCVIFSLVGNLAYELDVRVEDIVADWQKLAFVVIPDALSRLPKSPFWAILFFLTIVTMNVDTLFVNVETIITSGLDELRWIKIKRCVLKWTLPLIFCCIALLMGIPHLSPAGYYWVILMESSSVALIGWNVLIGCIVILYIYGVRWFVSDVKHMIGYDDSNRAACYWMAVYAFGFIPLLFAPIIITVAVILCCAYYNEPTVGIYKYPDWALSIGWLITLAPLAALLVYAIYHLGIRQRGRLVKRYIRSLQPSPEWGPALAELRYESGYRPKPPDQEEVLDEGRPGESYLYPEMFDQETQCDFEEL